MSEYQLDNGLIVVASERRQDVADLLEGATDRLREKDVQINDLKQNMTYLHNNYEIMQESMAELELALEDTGWQRLSGFGDREFSPAGLRKLRRLARLNYLKNPLIRNAVNIQAHYVWGQGVTISAADQKVNDLVQKFLSDPKNVISFSGHQARLDLEVLMRVESDIFLGLFTNEDTGRVVVRRFISDEISDIITNPDDYQEVWFYKRTWSKRGFNEELGVQSEENEVAYYPDWRLVYNEDPDVPRPKTIGGNDVMWDCPVYHSKVGGFSDQKNGCPEIYPALDWARAVKDDLEDYATVRRAHARFAWQFTTKGGKQSIQAGKTKLGSTMNQGGTGAIETNPPPVSGSVWLQSENAGNLQPFKTAGAQPTPEEAHRLWLMISSGTGIPEPMLTGNADLGNYATAKALDRPTELQMENRRQLWTDILLDILNYVIDMSIKAPNGVLKGEKIDDEYTGLVSYQLEDEGDREIEIRFPSILRHEILPLIQAIVQAATLNGQVSAGTIDDRTLSGLLHSALGENEYDDLIADMFPNQEFTFNAGIKPPPGADDSTVPRDGGAKQGSQSSSDAGLGDMGDDAPGGQDKGINFDPQVSSDLAMWASTRLRESVAGQRTRTSLNRSGITVVHKPKRGKKYATHKTRSTDYKKYAS